MRTDVPFVPDPLPAEYLPANHEIRSIGAQATVEFAIPVEASHYLVWLSTTQGLSYGESIVAALKFGNSCRIGDMMIVDEIDEDGLQFEFPIDDSIPSPCQITAPLTTSQILKTLTLSIVKYRQLIEHANALGISREDYVIECLRAVSVAYENRIETRLQRRDEPTRANDFGLLLN